jgi:hypothetical protein
MVLAFAHIQVSVDGPLPSKDNVTRDKKMRGQPLSCFLVDEFKFLRLKTPITDVADVDNRCALLHVVTGLKLGSERAGLDIGCSGIN